MLKLQTVGKHLERTNKPFSGTLVGVVTDITKPLYRQKEGNYIVMIKIIDETLNDKRIFGVMSRDCAVYLISRDKEEIDFLRGVGDIVVLDKFTFNMWNGIKLQTRYQGTTEGLYFVGIDQKQKSMVTYNQITTNPQLFQLSEQLQLRIYELWEWSSNELSDHYQPQIGVNILNSHYVRVEPFNLILRFKSSKQGQKSYLLELHDSNQNFFYLSYENSDFAEGELLFVRGIQCVGHSYTIHLTQTGRILKIPEQKNYISSMNYMGIYKDSQKFTRERRENPFTVLSCENLERKYLKELMVMEDKYNHSRNKEAHQINDNYLIEVVPVNYRGKVNVYHKEFQVLLHREYLLEITPEQKKEIMTQNKIGFIYEGVIGLLDRSNQIEGRPFYINLFTSDDRGTFIEKQQIAELEKSIGKKEEENAKSKLLNIVNKKLERLIGESSFESPILLVVEPIRSQKLSFRLVNTIFI